MKVWVRSQDKKRLIEVNDFKIEKREIMGEAKHKTFVSDSEANVLQKAEFWLKENKCKLIRDIVYRDMHQFVCGIDYREQGHYVFDIDSGYATLGTYSTEEKALKVLDMIFEAVEQGHNFIMPSDDEE